MRSACGDRGIAWVGGRLSRVEAPLASVSALRCSSGRVFPGQAAGPAEEIR